MSIRSKRCWAMAAAISGISFLLGGLIFLNYHYYEVSHNFGLTSEEVEWLANHEGGIVLGCDPYFPPSAFIDGEEHKGIYEDIFKLIESRIGIKFKRVASNSWDELLEDMQRGRIDVVGAIMKTDSRSDYLNFTQPVFNLPTVIIVRKSEERDLKLTDLANMSVAITKGYAITEYLDKNFPEIRYHTVKSDFFAIKEVAFHQADAMITDMATASYMIEKWGFTNLRIAGDAGFTYKLSIASSKRVPILNTILVKALMSITHSEKDEIFSRWVEIKDSPILLSGTFWYSILALFSAITLIALRIFIWNRMLNKKVVERTEELEKYKNRLEELVEIRTAELTVRNEELKHALDEISTLKGLIPVCSWCKKVKDDEGYWTQVDEYLKKQSGVKISHGMCPECAEKYFSEIMDRR